MIGSSPQLGSSVYAWAGLSTDTKPAQAFIGQLIIETDTGFIYEWIGTEWKRIHEVLRDVEVDPLVATIPTTGTFHHLGHEGKLFIHSDKHTGVTNGANFDYLIRIPAGNAARQVHFRFNYSLAGATPGTDVEADLILYKDTVVSADGTPETLVSTNDAVVKTTGVLTFESPTVTDVGTQKAQTLITSARRSGGSQEQIVPEWILAPDGTSARDYLVRLINNSGGTITVVNAIFFYDSEAA